MDDARRDRMIRTALFVLAALALAGLAAWAQSTVPESDDSRYTFNRVDDGYLRLDGRTGQVSICARRPAGWTCEAVPDERAALELEAARLQLADIVEKKRPLAHTPPLPSTIHLECTEVQKEENQS